MVEVRLGPRTVDVPFSLRLYGVSDALFDEWVDEDTHAELINGVMVVHSPASLRHDDLSGFLRTLFRAFADERGLGLVLGPDGLIRVADGHRYGPDIFFVGRERVPRPLPKEIDIPP